MHIDWWTLALQAINVLILVWLLGRFLYRPVVAIMDQRRAETAKALADASAMRDAAEAERTEIQTTRDGFVAEREKLLTDARRQIEAERDTMLRQASERIDALRTQNDAALARERAAMERELAEQAGALAVEIARKLLARIPSDATMSIFLDGLAAQIAALSPQNRKLIAAQSDALRLATASALSESQQRHCETAIEASLGAKAKVTFRVDPKLIAGFELNAGSLVLTNCWQADLSQILERLKSDDGQR